MKIVTNILKGIVFLSGTAAILFIAWLNLTGSAFMPLHESEIIEFQTNNILLYLISLTVLVLIIALTYFAFRNPNGFISQNGTALFFLIGTILYLGLGLYLIFRIPETLRSDASILYKTAGQIKNGDFSALLLDKTAGNLSYADGYLAKNPHQIGLTILLSLLLRVLPGVRFVFILNLILILLNNLLILNIAHALFNQDDHVCFMTVLLSFLMLPHFFLCIFCYGIIPGLTALLFSILSLIKFENSGNVLYAIAAVITASIAVVIRNNYMIGVIAEIILLLLVFFRSLAHRDGRKKSGGIRYLVTAVFLILVLFVPNTLLEIGVTRASGVKLTDSVPKTAWVAMGLSESERAEGWYNGYVYTSFADNGYNEKATDEAARALIAERMDTFKADPDYAYTFFMRKLASTWTEPTFQSVWVGPQGDVADDVGGYLYKNLYAGGTAYDICCLLCNILYYVLLAGCILFILKYIYQIFRKRTDRYSSRHDEALIFVLFPLLFLLGGFLFHLGWETKSLYVFCYVYMLLPLAARGLSFD